MLISVTSSLIVASSVADVDNSFPSSVAVVASEALSADFVSVEFASSTLSLPPVVDCSLTGVISGSSVCAFASVASGLSEVTSSDVSFSTLSLTSLFASVEIQ